MTIFRTTAFCLMIASNFYITAVPTWAEETLHKMTVDEKIGQLLMIAVPCNPDKPEIQDRLFSLNLPKGLNTEYAQHMIKNYHVGGVLFICEGTMPEQVRFTNALQKASALPLLVAQDFEPGLVRLTDAIVFPRAKILGETCSTKVIEEIGEHIGRQAQRLGVHVVFAPVCDVHTNPDNPVINTRSFGGNPQHVAKCATALMHGIQKIGVLACAKHFPGHGDTSVDSHKALPCVPHSMDRLEAVELVPFRALIAEGVQSVMLGHLLVPVVDEQNPTSLSSACIKKLLQEKLGFRGLIFSDALIMKALSMAPGESSLRALLAGTTMAVFPDDVPASFEKIKQAVQDGIFLEKELDEKVLMILQVKEKLGLHEYSIHD